MRRTASPLPYPPVLAAPVAAGFPSPADDYIDKPLCLNEWLVPENAAYAPLAITEGLDGVIWGGVTRVIHAV